MKPDVTRIMATLLELYADQHGLKIEYEIKTKETNKNGTVCND